MLDVLGLPDPPFNIVELKLSKQTYIIKRQVLFTMSEMFHELFQCLINVMFVSVEQVNL